MRARDNFRRLRLDCSKMPRGLETCAAAYLRLRQIPQLLHLPRSALRRAAAADTWPRIAYVPTDAEMGDDKVFWDCQDRAHTSRLVTHKFGSRFAVTSRMLLTGPRRPAVEWKICCNCGAPVAPWPSMPWAVGFKMMPRKFSSESARKKAKEFSFDHRVQLERRREARPSIVWYVADLLSRPIVRELRLCKPCEKTGRAFGSQFEEIAFRDAAHAAKKALAELGSLIKRKKTE